MVGTSNQSDPEMAIESTVIKLSDGGLEKRGPRVLEPSPQR